MIKHASRSCRDFDVQDGFAYIWSDVTCRTCCSDSSNPRVVSRLAELDRAQAQGGIWVDPSGKTHVEPPIALTKRVPNPTGRPSTTRIIDVTLLTRLSDFIASIPGNALDRKSNALAMTLRREIADVVCPADKVRG